MKPFHLLSVFALVALGACSVDSVSSPTSPIDPTNPVGIFHAVTADGVILPARQTSAADASGTTTTLQINTSNMTLSADGTMGVDYQYYITRKTAAGATSVQSYVSSFTGTWGFANGIFRVTLYDSSTGQILQFNGATSASGVTITTDFGIFGPSVGVPIVFKLFYQT